MMDARQRMRTTKTSMELTGSVAINADGTTRLSTHTGNKGERE